MKYFLYGSYDGSGQPVDGPYSKERAEEMIENKEVDGEIFFFANGKYTEFVTQKTAKVGE
jgi:hypothetical protein